MKITFDPDGGDLGRGAKFSTILEIMTVVPHIADIFQVLYTENHDNPDYRPYKYGFETFTGISKTQLQVILKSIQLPHNVKWYDCDGNIIFEMRGASGGVVTGYICYLITDVR
jgi:hypothetical protein